MSLQIAAPLLGVRAVIAEARRRQHRRRLIVIAGVACAIVLASIAFIALGHRGAGQPKFVKVYFAFGANSAQILRTITAVKAEHGVTAVSLLTKEAALADMKGRFPNLVAGLGYNPLPDSIQVQVSRADAARVISDLKKAQPFAIVEIRESPGPG
jgi:cell division protein FtsX